MTRIEAARNKKITDDIMACAAADQIEIKQLLRWIAKGQTVILRNTQRPIAPVAIGKGAPVRVNANIGSSDSAGSRTEELEKMRAAINAGADTIMDLSTSADLQTTRKDLLAVTPVPVGSVPLYEAMAVHERTGGKPEDMEIQDMLAAIEAHVSSGIDFVTIHSGIRSQHISYTANRAMGIVSRGGSFIAEWMSKRGLENPLFSHFDDILDILYQKDVAISLGDALRPGALSDAGDKAQYAELRELARLGRRALKRGVQTIIEGPGHVPLHEVEAQIKLQKRLCRGAPFYILGPLVTDSAAGYDHIAGAIGGAVAAMAGADFLCYLTPREHLGLPDIEHVIDGVAASKIAAHAADLTRGNRLAWQRDHAISRARLNLNWPEQFANALQPERAKELFKKAGNGETCSMCGALCSARRTPAIRETQHGN